MVVFKIRDDSLVIPWTERSRVISELVLYVAPRTKVFFRQDYLALGIDDMKFHAPTVNAQLPA